ncbi:MAG: hypothetical protein GY874_04470 [Desulfobacteraceae bacterium]|nr:hypothetical protein [Desulfobacteraceae bacterium]
MAEISHEQLADVLKKKKEAASSQTWLIHGEQVLVEKACEKVKRFFLGESFSDLNCLAFEGAAENIGDLLEQMNTFSLLGGTQVAIFKDAKFFGPQRGKLQPVQQIQQAWETDQSNKAVRLFLNLCSRLGVVAETVVKDRKTHAELKQLAEVLGEDAFSRLADIAQQSAQAGAIDDAAEWLRSAIEKGFAQDHHLVVTAYSRIAKNTKFYKTIKSKGSIVDCNVPKGERQADKAAQQEALRKLLQDMLQQAGKRLAPRAFNTLVQLTGFDLRIAAQNVEKLIDYAGQRRQITDVDVSAVVRRSKADPIFELTSALADRNASQAVFYLNTLLNAGFHPLQLLAAMANQLRKLLIAKDFTLSRFGKRWTSGLSYHNFQQQVVPDVLSFDAFIQEQAVQWREDLPQGAGPGAKENSDLRLAANPKSAYPVFQTLIKSEKFERHELLDDLAYLSEIDVRFKSIEQDEALVLRKTVMSFCMGKQSARTAGRK